MNRREEPYDEDGDYAISGHDEEYSDEQQLHEQEVEDGEEEVEDNEEGEEEVDVDEEEEDVAEEEVGSIEGAAPNGNSDRWVSSLQELLGTLAHGMEGRRGLDEVSGSRRVNLVDVFPEYRQMFGMMGGVGRGEGNRMHTLVENVVNAKNDPYVAMESLREINEQLLMLNPLTAERTVPQLELLKGIINIMDHPQLSEELELQLISCRCLYNLFEMNPDMVSAAVDRHVILALQKKLVEISYIDLAEQVLETLEYISRLSGREILKSGCLVECLQYVDFFTVHAQRKAVTIVSNACACAKAADYEHILAFFPLLKGVFINNRDQGILTKMLNAIYSISGTLGPASEKQLESLIDLEIIKRIIAVVSSSDIDLDGKLKSLDILSQLVSTSSTICRNIIESCDIYGMLMGCFNDCKKTANSTLHEVLMFVPKQLLVSISRFITLLLPTEDEQLLSIDGPRNLNVDSNSAKYVSLVKQLTPFLAEIYLNTVDFDIRRYLLISFARIASSMNSNQSYIDKQLIGLISSSITQNKSTYCNEKGDKLVAGGLLVGLLSLSSIMIAKCAAEVLPALKREGTLEMLKSLSEHLHGAEDDKVKESTKDYNDGEEQEEEEEEEEEGDTHDSISSHSSDDDYDMEFGDVDVPDHVKPKKMNFTVFRPLTVSYIEKKLSLLCQYLMENFSSNEESVINELREIEELVSQLHMVDYSVEESAYWATVWATVKEMIFQDNFTISGFEFISTGLSESISKIIKAHPSRTSTCQSMFIKVFDDKLELLIKTLQSALTKLESFEIIDCGTSERRAASLGKQMKIRLEYIGDMKKDVIPAGLSSLTVSIHCISSYETLNEFLKHRIAQSRFLSSILLLSNPPNSSASDDVKNMNFQFQVGDEIINSSETVFGSIFKYISNANKNPSQIWNEIQVIKYRRVYEHPDSVNLGRLYPEHVFTREELKPIDGILDLLACCYNSSLDPHLFINPKITVKLSRQLEEPLIVASGALPRWTLHVTRNYSFLFPLDVRMFFLQNTSFGYGRLIQLWRDRTDNEKDSAGEEQLQQLGRPTRHKLRILRENMFLSALKILSKYGSSPNVLEIEYQDEVGTGMGPTLEFYASVSKEFARKSLQMWHCPDNDTDDDGFVKGLLFPSPLSQDKNEVKILELFSHLGTFIARSMLDNRILDFRFNRVFFELMHCRVRGEQLDFTHPEILFELLEIIDPQLESSLKYIWNNRDSASLEALSLYFVLPGYKLQLIENGANIPVTSENVALYISEVFDAFLGSGIDRQLTSFIEGFSRAFPYSSLLVLTPNELCDLFGRVEEDWSIETLYSCITADHGYSMDSPTLHNLIDVMFAFEKHERRLFLQFLTGSPKLPIGGFKNLKPHLTVVLKHPEGDLTPDQYLPSVMTCANYLKLPKYTTKDVLRSRIVQAMNEGSGAFLLS
ncbi:putative ubiquitin-protein ligase UFD4 Ecym_2435 [Eremothecium cymbalariae DBVPG|uniref:HECT-type E3 ubiquitin transferase n=1 Tax=Eremothecium cymbalariae (strain CBS 270.75 / DBVPG 7215 / KCTC 17166 / NRRL Y-17582) TaxID=931890 RepID=G8JPA7_ERECY|nr:Hypothetical protein Ecym_2435 [Eremothecium cymbalariae DBVPG\